MVKVMLDPGHGDFDSGAVGNGLRECDLTWKFATKTGAILQGCGVTTYYTREQNKTVKGNQAAELGYRCQLANQKGVNAYISFHNNSGGATGFESYRYLGNNPETVHLQQLVHGNVAPIFTSNGMPDRGIKIADFAVLRGTNMPAILLELGFIDNARDAKYISTDDFQNKGAESVARAICEWLGIPFVTEAIPAPKEYELYYNGYLESLFTDKSEAYKYGWSAYNDAGHKDAYLVEPNGNVYTFDKHKDENPKAYKLYYAGFLESIFTDKDEAFKYGWMAYNEAGHKDAYLVTTEGWDYSFDKHQEENPQQLALTPVQQTPILGDSQATAEQLVGHGKTVNPQFPDILGLMYLETGKKYGVRGDIAFAQMLHETNYFRFGKDVQANQNNFAGLGATDGGAVMATFTTPQDGIQAHIQHLYGYASTGLIPEGEPLVDPRFHLITRGSAINWEDLNGKWSVPGTTYGQDILAIYEKISIYEVPIDPLDEAKTNGFLIGDPNQPITAGNVAILLNRLFREIGGK